MTQAWNLSQLGNNVNASGQLDASTGLYNTTSLGFPSGTRMSFNQTAAPTGWTKDTTAALNDSIMRIVTGTVGSGGSTAFSTFNAQTATSAYTLTIADIPSHTHTGAFISGTTLSTTSSKSNNSGALNTSLTGATGGGGAHSHGMTTAIKYNDFIIAIKN